MALHMANPAHAVAYNDLVALLRKHADDMTALELLAVAANMVGKLVALQDQRTVTPTAAMEVVWKNIERGNAEAWAELSKPTGSA